MDTLAPLSRSQVSARRVQNGLLTAWQLEQRPALTAYLAATLAQLVAMEDIRRTLHFVRDVVRHDCYAVDAAGGALDFISDTVGELKGRLDNEGGDPDAIKIDDLELRQAHARLGARAAARS